MKSLRYCLFILDCKVEIWIYCNSLLVVIFFILGSSWKRVRSTLTPTFSSAKMKKMSGIMSEAIKITSDVIGKNADASQEINVYELFQGKVLQNQQNIALFCIKGKNHYFFYLLPSISRVKSFIDTHFYLSLSGLKIRHQTLGLSLCSRGGCVRVVFKVVRAKKSC